MAVTMSDLRTMISRELENNVYHAAGEFVGDGETATLLVTPVGSSIVSGTFLAYDNNVLLTENTDYTIDLNSGLFSLLVIPDSTQTITVEFDYKAFSDTIIDAAVEAAIQSLFPSIYVTDITTASTDGTAYEFQLAAGSEFVTRLEYKGTGSTDRYYTLRRHLWELHHHGVDKIIHFFTPPPQGTLRVHTILRPSPLGASNLLSIGVPERAQHAIVSYACWHLLTQKMAPRVRSDVAIITQGKGAVYPIQMNQAAQAFAMRAQFQLASVKMPPWSAV